MKECTFSAMSKTSMTAVSNVAAEDKLKCFGVLFFTIDESGINSEPMIHRIIVQKGSTKQKVR